MATDTQAILDAAEKVGQMVKEHPSYERYKSAAKSVAEDPEAGRLVADFNRQLETLLRQEQSGMPVSDAQHAQLESLQQRIASHLKMKAMHLAQVDFYDLLRKVTQTIQKPLADVGGAPGAGAGAGAGGGGGPRIRM
ncbi:MAG TPA: YlbF family regulator [Tepidisphaeraceae bacterium]|nr:YlbF family regulator [Tepidisphaeraceae bacterium]